MRLLPPCAHYSHLSEWPWQSCNGSQVVISAQRFRWNVRSHNQGDKTLRLSMIPHRKHMWFVVAHQKRDEHIHWICYIHTCFFFLLTGCDLHSIQDLWCWPIRLLWVFSGLQWDWQTTVSSLLNMQISKHDLCLSDCFLVMKTVSGAEPCVHWLMALSKLISFKLIFFLF